MGQVPLPPVDLGAVFAALPTPYVVMTPELVIVAANTAYLQTVGRPWSDLVGRALLEAFPPPPDALDAQGRSEVQVSLERARDTARPDTLPVQKYPIAGSDGVMTERHWLAVHVPVLDAEGRVVLLVQRTEDVTEFALERERLDRLAQEQRTDAGWRRRAERVEADLFTRARELADALEAKDAAARQVASLTDVALALSSAESEADLEQIVVGHGLRVLGADGGAIIARARSGGWHILANAALSERVRAAYGDSSYDSPLPGCWTGRTGERLLFPTRASGLAFHPIMAQVYADTGRSGWAFLPLAVAGERLGALAISWVREHQPSPGELDVLDGFAAQCAQALYRVRTGQARQAAAQEVLQLAEALQQALLTPPPEPDDLHIVVRYRPAAHVAQVGGDWYDAFLQPDGATMLSIGDVVGHDGVAAARMGQLRGLLRALAYSSADAASPEAPSAILTRVEHAARGLALDTLSTTILARIETAGAGARLLHWANAGHPPPALLHADGAVDLLDSDLLGARPDLLLGVDPDVRRQDHRTALPDGATLLLYTDGLIERRGSSLDEGLARLRTALGDLADRTPDDLCTTLLTRLAPGAGDDDIALIAVRIRPRAPAPVAAPAQIVLDLPDGLDAPAIARRFLADHAVGLAPGLLDDAQLLVSELVTNAVRYGRPSVTLRLRLDPPGVGVEVEDHGDVLPVLADGQPDRDATSGRGLLIVAAIADSWGVTPLGSATGKTVWFTLRSG